MMESRVRGLRSLLVAAGIALIASAASAQSSRTIKIVVPSPPGGSVDILGRLLGQQISEAHGVKVLVESRPGAGTIVATDAVARAAPDGNTVLIVANAFVIIPHIRKLNYDPLSSFAPVAQLVTSPQVLVVNSASSYRTFGEFIEAARTTPGGLTMGSVGPATTAHIGLEQLKRITGANLTFVPFPGNTGAVNALLGEHLTSALANYVEVFEQLKAGRLRALATTSRARIPQLPDLPTVAELGYPGYECEVWFGLVAPAGTPKETVGELAQWFVAAMQAPDVKQRLMTLGLNPITASDADFVALLHRKHDEYGRIIREANIRGE
jgi:tripartite-type tricarboxylate transporter receptor subunit TctC